ncbi:TPA: hypothetical protein DD712_03040, partial [Candidatus Acetothermia bacterium]|nr:hypothetical protein [Candidatus Acetothermia bacterium]
RKVPLGELLQATAHVKGDSAGQENTEKQHPGVGNVRYYNGQRRHSALGYLASRTYINREVSLP